MSVARRTIGLLIAGAAIFFAAHAGAARADAPLASYDDTGVLRKRLLAAINAAKRPQNFDHVESLIEILRAIEKDHGLNLQTGDLMRAAAETDARLKTIYLPESPRGIAFYRPLEAAARAKPKQVNNVVVEALGLSSICLAAEADYNERYAEHFQRQPWPTQDDRHAVLRYAVFLRMYKRDCISTKAFNRLTASLVAGVRRAMLGGNIAAGDSGAYAYLLAASNRLDQIPAGLLSRFVLAQEAEGSWPSTHVGDPAVAAAQGAYIIAEMLRRRGVQVTDLEVFHAAGSPPQLPPPVRF